MASFMCEVTARDGEAVEIRHRSPALQRSKSRTNHVVPGSCTERIISVLITGIPGMLIRVL